MRRHARSTLCVQRDYVGRRRTDAKSDDIRDGQRPFRKPLLALRAGSDALNGTTTGRRAELRRKNES